MNFYDFNFEFGVIVTTIFLFVMAFVSYIFYKNEKTITNHYSTYADCWVF